MSPSDAVGPRLRVDDAAGWGGVEVVGGADERLRLRADTDAAVLALIRVSLATWQVPASIGAEPHGGWRLDVDGVGVIRVGRAPEGIPFRWMIEGLGRQRPASSVAGLLRVLRGTLDPAWRPGRARVVAATLEP